jgi:hypothetical protein
MIIDQNVNSIRVESLRCVDSHLGLPRAAEHDMPWKWAARLPNCTSLRANIQIWALHLL